MFDHRLKMSEAFQHSKHRYNLKHRFDIVKSLGQGTYGRVKLAVDKRTGQKVAIKSIVKKKISTEQDLIKIRREIEIMASLSHEHIIQIFEVFENKEKIILVMEYADGGELYDYISSRGRLCEREARRLFRQIVSALHHLHEKGIVHRDLKLENILLDKNGCVKLADFGLSNTWQHNKLLKTFCGSPLYASPEIVSGRPYYGPEVDCWSLGVLLYTLVYGAMPFDGSDFNKLKKQITQGCYFEPAKQSDAAGLIRSLLTVNPARRANIVDVVAHWWVNKDTEGFPDDLLFAEHRTSDYYEEEPAFSDESEKHKSACDLSKKPPRGILKNRKMSNGDSGCALSDTKDNELSLNQLAAAIRDIDPNRTNSSTKTLPLHTVQLKKSPCPVKRNSLSSNSSGDVLDFSYDSSEGGADYPVFDISSQCESQSMKFSHVSTHNPEITKMAMLLQRGIPKDSTASYQ